MTIYIKHKIISKYLKILNSIHIFVYIWSTLKIPDSPATAVPLRQTSTKTWAGVVVRHGSGKANGHSFAMIIASENAR